MGKLKSNKTLGRFIKNFLGFGYGQIITLAAQFVTVPFFLKFWGRDRYAEWIIMAGIPTMLTLLDFGVSQASSSRAIISSEKNDIEKVKKIIQTSFAFSITLCIVIISVTGLIAGHIDWTHALKLKSINNSDAAFIMLTLVATLSINLFGNTLNGWFRVIDHTAIGIFLLSSRRLIDILVTISVIIAGFGIKELSICLLAAQFTYLLAMVYYAHTSSKWQILGLSCASIAEFKIVIKPSFAYLGITLGQVLILQGGLQILNQVSTAATVVVFSMGRTMMRLVLQVGMVSFNAIRPELSKLIGQNKQLEAKNFVAKISRITSALSTITFVALVSIGPLVITNWSGGKVITTRVTLAMIGLHALFNVYWYVKSALLSADNKHGNLSKVYSFSCVISSIIWLSISQLGSPIAYLSICMVIPEITMILYTNMVGRKKIINCTPGDSINS